MNTAKSIREKMESPDNIRKGNCYITEDGGSIRIHSIDDERCTLNIEVRKYGKESTFKTIDLKDFHEMRKLSLNW